VAEAVRELSHFRAALLDLCAEKGAPLQGQAAQLIHATIDEGMITVAAEMERAVTEELRQNAGFRERFGASSGTTCATPSRPFHSEPTSCSSCPRRPSRSSRWPGEWP
jgi:hypothetical protein